METGTHPITFNGMLSFVLLFSFAYFRNGGSLKASYLNQIARGFKVPLEGAKERSGIELNGSLLNADLRRDSEDKRLLNHKS